MISRAALRVEHEDEGDEGDDDGAGGANTRPVAAPARDRPRLAGAAPARVSAPTAGRTRASVVQHNTAAESRPRCQGKDRCLLAVCFDSSPRKLMPAGATIVPVSIPLASVYRRRASRLSVREMRKS